MASVPNDQVSVQEMKEAYIPMALAMVTIEVGPEKSKFELFRDHLDQASPYFKRAFHCDANQVHMKEALSQSIWLRYVDVNTFESFCYWLHIGKIPKFEPEIFWLSMIGLWLFGDGHEVYELMNSTIDAIIEWASDKKPPPFNSGMLHVVYGNTVASSPLRKVLVDLAIHIPGNRWLRSDLSGEYPDEFLDQVIEAQRGVVRGNSLLDPNGRTKLELVVGQVAATYNVDLRDNFPSFKAEYHVAPMPTTLWAGNM